MSVHYQVIEISTVSVTYVHLYISIRTCSCVKSRMTNKTLCTFGDSRILENNFLNSFMFPIHKHSLLYMVLFEWCYLLLKSMLNPYGEQALTFGCNSSKFLPIFAKVTDRLKPDSVLVKYYRLLYSLKQNYCFCKCRV